MNGRTPAPIDEDGALAFEEKPRPSQSGATIRLAYQGVPVDLQVTDKKIGQIEQLIAGLLARGWTAPPQPRGGGFGAPKDMRIDAAIDAQGNEVCPVHKVPVRTYEGKDGRPPFKGCPSKATGASGEKINERGYCTLRFK